MSETIPKLKSRIKLYVGGILAAVICISGFSIYEQYHDVVASAERQAAGYARVLAEHSESAFAEADRMLRDSIHDMAREGGVGRFDRRALFDLLRRQAEDAPQVGAMFIVDKDGAMLANSNQFPQPSINVFDRDYFRYYLNNPGADLTISKPVMSRLVNRWRFNLMRSLPHSGSNFGGLLAVAFEVSYFKNFLGPTSLGPRGRVMLIRNDGAPLVYEPYVDKAYETDFRTTTLFSKKLFESPSGTYQVAHSAVDREPRIISYQRLQRFPVVAVVALHKGDALGPWGKKSIFQSLMTAGLCLVIVILTRLMFRQMDSLQSTRFVVDEQEELLRVKATQIDAASDAILLIDEHGRLAHFNKALCSMTGYSEEELTGISLYDIRPAEFAAKIIPNTQLLKKLGHATFESAYLAKDGTIIPTEVHVRSMDGDGQPLFLSIERDISQRKRDEIRDLTRLRILEGMATGSSLSDLLELIVRFVEQESKGSLCSVLLVDESGTRLMHGAAPTLPDSFNRAVDGLKIGQQMGSNDVEAFAKHRQFVEELDRHPFWSGFKPAREAGLHACWSEPVLSPDGELLGMFVMYYRESRSPKDDEIQFIDSAAYLASIAIGRVREEELRKKLEAQLLHIQKIEAIGQLAGGIAHDFNNLLTPILIYAEMARRGLPEEHPQRRRVEGVINAAHKAKDLTQKLLSFGRKQMLRMEVLDLNEVIASFRDIMRRTIRENIAIDIKLAPGGARILADRSQLEQILLNLTVNAQDAINGVGTISVSTGHLLLDDEYARHHHGVVPGPYILLVFSDNGCGMDDETLRHIYEPFFTTKAVGRGTGLGLATVYGIIKQHEGYIEARSHVGEGTSFLVYLPATTEKIAAADAALPSHDRLHDPASATVLLVEDNAMVREMAVDLLESEGFKVLVADSPSKAQEIERSFEGTINLLLTDVVMPEMNGMELYESLRDRRPAMPVLYVSGYTSDVIIHNGTLEEEVNFLKKPFTVEKFRERVRQSLGLI